MTLKSLLIAGLMTISASLMAQKKTPTLDELLWGGKTFWNYQPQRLYTAWAGDRALELTPTEARKLTDKDKKVYPEVLFTLDEVNASVDTALGKVRNLAMGRFLYASEPLVFFTTNKGELLYDFEQKKVVWSTTTTAGESHNDFHAPSRQEAFVRGDNLFVRTAEGQTLQVTTDGSRNIVYGQPVHRDEFGIKSGTYWSPKGALLAFYRMDQSMVTDYPLVDIEHRIAEVAPTKYPMAGETSHEVTIGIFNPRTQATVYLQAGNPKDRYFSNISWSPDERTIYVFEAPRSQKSFDIVAYDAQTGARKAVLYSESNEKYAEPQEPLAFLPWDESQFLFQSQRDGYNHLYLFNLKTNTYRQVTKGQFVVLSLDAFNSDTKSVIISSNESHPLRHNYYAVHLKTGKRTLLDSGTGVHVASFSPSGRYAIDRWSSPTVDARTELMATATHKTVTLLDATDPLKEFALPEITSGSIKADDGTTDLYYRLVKPTDFDPAKKYPTVVYVYGGPHARNVLESRRYDARGWELYMAAKGYVVFVLDNRGSSERGFAFESATYRHLGDVEMRDQVSGVNFLKTLPYVDADRIGVHGWSFGGFMTTNLMCSYPEIFKVGVAGGPVIDWKFYEVMYGERYMGTPQNNPEGYASSSLLPKAKNLKGRLQIIHGYNDPVCVPQHTLSFLRACIDADTQPDLFLYPNQEHNMNGHDRIHLHERITRYFEDHLK